MRVGISHDKATQVLLCVKETLISTVVSVFVLQIYKNLFSFWHDLCRSLTSCVSHSLWQCVQLTERGRS